MTACSAGELVGALVTDLVEEVVRGVPAALADDPDAVHRLRTSVRRLRSVLSAFRRHLVPDVRKDLDGRLKELGAVLGEARDLEVRAGQLAGVAAEAGVGEGDVRLLVAPLEQERAAALVRLRGWWESDAGASLSRTLAAWAESPPLRRRGRSARKAARRAVHRGLRRVAERASSAESVTRRTEPGSDETPAHDLRKAGRRLRYVAEAVTTPPGAVLGKRTRRRAKIGHALQSTLGDLRDAHLLAAYAEEQLDPESAGPIVAVCRAGAEDARESLAATLAELRDETGRHRT